jgi:hypothetical protein
MLAPLLRVGARMFHVEQSGALFDRFGVFERYLQENTA